MNADGLNAAGLVPIHTFCLHFSRVTPISAQRHLSHPSHFTPLLTPTRSHPREHTHPPQAEHAQCTHTRTPFRARSACSTRPTLVAFHVACGICSAACLDSCRMGAFKSFRLVLVYLTCTHALGQGIQPTDPMFVAQRGNRHLALAHLSPCRQVLGCCAGLCCRDKS